MYKILISLLLVSCMCYAQDVHLTGKVTDEEDFPLESATIYLTRVKDSAVIKYSVSDTEGKWELKTSHLQDTTFLKISYIGTKNYKKKLPPLQKDREFGTIKLENNPKMLDTVVIEAEIPPIRIKQDTIEFNASSFKVRPDAKLKELMKKLPGVTIDSEGNLTFNGKPVNEILVDGEPFFDTNGQIAMENLPAEIIDKIQVSDAKTKKEEFAGLLSNGENASINITFKKGQNKGYFGNVTGGYGTNGRYEASVFVNYFKDKRKISFTGSSNNINASGFSFGMPGRFSGGMGRNIIIRDGISGFGGGSGLTKTYTAATNYTDKIGEDTNIATGYSYNSSSSENNSRNETTNFQPESEDPDNPGTYIDKSYITNSESKSNSESFSHTVHSDITFVKDSTLRVNYRPRFSRSESFSDNSSEQSSVRMVDDALLNESISQTHSESQSNNFGGNLVLFKNLNSKKGRGLSFTAVHNNRSNNAENRNMSVTKKYTYPNGSVVTSTDERNQVLYNNNISDIYTAGIEYYEPINDSIRIKIGTNYKYDSDSNNRDAYDFDALTDNYTLYNDSLSNYKSSVTSTLNPEAGVMINKNKFSLNLNAGADISTLNSYSFFLGNGYDFSKNYVLPSVSIYARYSLSGMNSIGLNYSFGTGLPSANQLMPIRDNSNPLHIFEGNPNLDPNRWHTVNTNYRNYNMEAKKGFNIYFTARYSASQVVAYTLTDDSAEQLTTYRNISGGMNTSIRGDWNKTYSHNEHQFMVRGNVAFGYSKNKGFLNGKTNNSTSYIVSPSINLDYEYGKLFSINPSYSFNYNQYNYSVYSSPSASNYSHHASLNTTTYWPKNVMWSNDVSFTLNSNMAPGFEQGFYVWNSSFGYSFLKEAFLFKVTVYDILNQNSGTSRTVTNTSIRDEENNVLNRYFMFSLTYKINKFGGNN